MADADFYIAFEGTAARYAALARFFDGLQSAKTALERDAEADRDAVVRNPRWIDLLDADAIEAMSGPEWSLEDLLDCILAGDYELVGLTFDGRAGRLEYNPWGYPFGGTDPLKALVEAFGLEVTRDSFHDGFAEWQERQG
ncbi:hypothetical protein [Urbifossiella limnaea]|uniref:Uncharacterized protein n=1 Tax=Urbifossiella limnaea TaxID=2528023 RepID=A0A517XQR3_9BACT|nr:hypothetical protein [Urbifossiella limnaea]QDU19850.1 hypothetical protein ETAA1_17880 [Urbifossiella limnaea]